MSKKMKQFSQTIPKHLLENQLFLRNGLTIPSIHSRHWGIYIVLQMCPTKGHKEDNSIELFLTKCDVAWLCGLLNYWIFHHTHLFPHHYLCCTLNNDVVNNMKVLLCYNPQNIPLLHCSLFLLSVLYFMFICHLQFQWFSWFYCKSIHFMEQFGY